ncbi:LysR family transcriptional regulator [Alteromonas confluentis]|uniref:LysR family transcriptional regulator n=1 Tax=Alteromonas confluentis TaxID=1656094 RepID=A0A1E7Z6C8_9ALTE|nr:LysR family transcriptional regulator [Alteromonas confluentis]OFC69086.1 LysR family transcriptional regulator [Alteromonas confluentis]
MLKTNNQSGGESLNNLRRLSYFVALYETGSFTAAADKMGISKAVVSQQIARLESEFQTTLLLRTTRRIQFTPIGESFYQRCTKILKEAEDAFGELHRYNSTPEGTLNLTAPLDFGIDRVVPAIKLFTERYPLCKVNLVLEDCALDLAKENLELGIRVGWLKEHNVQARKIGDFKQLLVASKAFEPKVQELTTPEQLAHLPFIANTVLKQPLDWRFVSQFEEEQLVAFESRISMDKTLAVKTALLSGTGLSVLPDYSVKSELDAGTLISVLPNWHLPSGHVYAVLPYARFRPARINAFIDILTAQV